MKRQVKLKVFVGLSGGVDSAVSAALLKEQGYDVTGVFIRIWQPEWTECTMKEDRLDAMRVCAKLGIPFKEIDLTEMYRRDVVDYMIFEYAAGRTPNPDVMCNRSIKFGKFLEWSLDNGADMIATGHYARNESQNNSFVLSRGIDESKDQTYFLWTLTQKQLSKTLFPVGHLIKSHVRNAAKRYGLPNANKKDSQGLCFVGQVDLKDFLSRYVNKKRGNVLNPNGKVIGYHDGAHLSTIGERHGFKVAHTQPDDGALYVIAKDIEANTITVGSKVDLVSVMPSAVLLKHVNWITGAPETDKLYVCEVRYHGQAFPCRIDTSSSTVRFTDSRPVISYGQSLVAYEGNICIGGGIIDVPQV